MYFLRVINLDSESSGDEFEDATEFNADEEFFSDSPPAPRMQYKYLSKFFVFFKTLEKKQNKTVILFEILVPDNTDDEELGSIQFVENYIEKFGEPYPTFTQGSLENVLKSACAGPAKDVSFLFIRVNRSQSILQMHCM